MKKTLTLLIIILLIMTQSNISQANTVYIGDSRFKMMKAVVHDRSIVAENSKGYLWLKSLNLTKYDRIVVNLGVNDLYNIKRYIKFYKAIMKYKELVIVSVNPVDEQKESKRYFVSNKQIKKFNKKLKKLGCTYINTYKNVKFNTTDGVHYDVKTSKRIYKYIKKKLKQIDKSRNNKNKCKGR